MNATFHNSENDNDVGQPIVRIEAQHVVWITPLREYFERHGCVVVVNRNITEVPSYVIGVGASSFVKHFFDNDTWRDAKKMAVIYEDDGAALDGAVYRDIKQYHVDPSPLNEMAAKNMCSFFFTGSTQIKNVRKERSRTMPTDVAPRKALREDTAHPTKQTDEDARRIEEEIHAVYRMKNQTERKSPRLHLWLVWCGVAIVLAVTPIVLYVLSIVYSAGLLFLSTKTLERGSVGGTQALITYSGTYRSFAQGMLSLASPVFLWFRQDMMIEDQDRLLSILQQIASAESGVVKIFQKSNVVVGGVFNPNGMTQPVGVSDVMELRVEVSRVYAYLGLAVSQLDTLIAKRRFPFEKPYIAKFTSQALRKLSRVRATVGYTEKLLTLYPHVAGFRKKQTYLVLLQNSMELRPTGGFIGSLLLITFADGKVETLDVQDVYTADGQLKGHVDPPRPIREILGNEHWYLRDSNWDPDFSKSGERAKWFYEKEMNQPIDGVIALSLPFVTQLLAVTGPIELLDFNERISESNFFAKSLLYTEAGFFPGSTRKKDFLGGLTQALLTRITTDRHLPAGLLLSAFEKGIEARDIQFYFTDMEIERLSTQWGWHGGVDIEQCQSVYANVRCVGDGVAVVDANLGVNKVNFFITREATEEVVIAESGDVTHALTMSMQNAASVNSESEWVYVHYVRVYVPKDAIPDAVLLNGNAIPKRENDSMPLPAPYWMHEVESDTASIHVMLALPPSSSHQLTLRWTRPSLIPRSSRVVYQLTTRKQSGVTTIPWKTSVEYPPSWAVVREGGVAKPGVFEYTTDLTKDGSVRLLFQKNL